MKVLSREIVRGHIDAIVLSAFGFEPLYGLDVKRCIEEKTNGLYSPSDQTLYTAFHRLEDFGFIKGSWGTEVETSKRKYYTITETGKGFLILSKKEWENTKKLIDFLLS